MDDQRESMCDQMNAYLDGELDAADRAAFEAKLSRNPDLRARLERARSIEEGLSRVFPPREAPEGAIPDGTARRQRRASFRIGARWLAYAAALALIGAGWLAVDRWNARLDRPDAAEVYRAVAAGAAPQEACSTPGAFATYTDEAYGRPVRADFDSGVEFIGWIYPQEASYERGEEVEGVRVLMARARDGAPIAVFFAESPSMTPRLADDSDLRIFSKRIGPVRVHEVTPLESPVVLGLLSARAQ